MKALTIRSRFVILLLLLFLSVTKAFAQTEQFKLEARQLGLIEQTLLNQAIENDPEIKELEKKLNRAGLTKDIGNLSASTLKSSIRIINLSSTDSSVRFITNGINLGSDIINVATIGYKIYKIKKVKAQLENKVNKIKFELVDVFNRLTKSKDDIEAKQKLVSYIGEKSTNDYLNWLGRDSKR